MAVGRKSTHMVLVADLRAVIEAGAEFARIGPSDHVWGAVSASVTKYD